MLQSFQIPDSTGEEQAENHVHIVGEAFATLLLVADEVNHHVCLVIADGNGDVAFVDDTQGHGGVWCA